MLCIKGTPMMEETGDINYLKQILLQSKIWYCLRDISFHIMIKFDHKHALLCVLILCLLPCFEAAWTRSPVHICLLKWPMWLYQSEKPEWGYIYEIGLYVARFGGILFTVPCHKSCGVRTVHAEYKVVVAMELAITVLMGGLVALSQRLAKHSSGQVTTTLSSGRGVTSL